MWKVERLRWRLERGKGDGKGEKVKEQVQGASLASAAEPIRVGKVGHSV